MQTPDSTHYKPVSPPSTSTPPLPETPAKNPSKVDALISKATQFFKNQTNPLIHVKNVVASIELPTFDAGKITQIFKKHIEMPEIPDVESKTKTLFKGVVLSPEDPEIGGGASKIARLISNITPERVKAKNSKIKTYQRTPMEKLEHAGKKIKSKVNKGIHQAKILWAKVSGTPIKTRLEKSFNKALQNPTKMNEFLINMNRIVYRIELSESDKESYPTLHAYKTAFADTDTRIERKHLTINKQQREKFFNDLDKFLSNSQIGLVPYEKREADESGNQMDYETEVKNVEMISSKLKKVSHPFKNFLAIPLKVIIKESKEQILVGRKFNLGDVKKRPLSYFEKNEAAIQTAKGLSSLHAAKIVHCDLAARNILAKHKLDKQGNYKLQFALTDFGLAKKEGEKWNHDHAPIMWASPEQFSRGVMTSKSDVWSFGVLLLELMEPETRISNIYSPENNAVAQKNHITAFTELRSNNRSFNAYMAHLINNYESKKQCTMDPELKSLILACFNDDPQLRPTMDDIIFNLELLQKEGRPFGFYPIAPQQ